MIAFLFIKLDDLQQANEFYPKNKKMKAWMAR